MGEKVKVSREAARALGCALEEYDGDKDLVLQNHKYDWIEECIPLNNFTHLEIAEMFIKGIEIEETPEEAILRDFLIEKRNSEEAISSSAIRSRGYVLGVRETLNRLGIKIKGIND